MSFWWVNHSQTFDEELEGGYIWSPQKKKNGQANEGYDNLPRTSVGDTIFSYADTKIQAVGRISDSCQVEQRPAEFGTTGNQWDEKGWRVNVQWTVLATPFSPKNYLEDIVPLLPAKHSPIRATGDGNQGIYLASINDLLGDTLLSLINSANDGIFDQLEDIAETINDKRVIAGLLNDKEIPVTQKQQLVQARIGQGLFRQNVERLESACRVTGVKDKRLLIASHIKPWKTSTNKERLDGHNGLLLSPHIDKLFDKGWISFSEKGVLLISSKDILSILQMWHINPNHLVGAFTEKQKRYLEHHQKQVFKG